MRRGDWVQLLILVPVILVLWTVAVVLINLALLLTQPLGTGLAP